MNYPLLFDTLQEILSSHPHWQKVVVSENLTRRTIQELEKGNQGFFTNQELLNSIWNSLDDHLRELINGGCTDATDSLFVSFHTDTVADFIRENLIRLLIQNLPQDKLNGKANL